MPSPSNDNRYMRRAPRVGECGLEAEDTGLDMWLSLQYADGEPSLLLKLIAVQAWERSMMKREGSIRSDLRSRFLCQLGLTNEGLVAALERYGWVFLSHHGPRK